MGTKSEILYDEATIAQAVEEVAQTISNDFRGQDILLVVILKGAFVFAADLLRAIERIATQCNGVASCRVEFMRTSSYGDAQVPGEVKIELDVGHSLRDQNVIIVDDVGDTLHTLAHLIAHLQTKGPKTLRTAVLLTKPHRHERADVTLDYVGIVGDGVGFVVGYGMDDKGLLRGLPYIGEVKND
ncbi:hypoxanthine phosphoribosyltransferase [Candidatus Uhrbacteria bacterium]|nr:hypoxanthine phosphoribosyltransferase [Candidatus Uhrbacteria bacterium]